MSTFFLTVLMTTLLRNKEVAGEITLKLIRNSWESTATAGNTHDKECRTCAKEEDLEEDSQPNYSEIAYQLLKTFAGQRTSSWIYFFHLTIGEFVA